MDSFDLDASAKNLMGWIARGLAISVDMLFEAILPRRTTWAA